MNGKTEKLIQAHMNARSHLGKLLEGLNKDQWEEQHGRWSIQKSSSHIVNAELYLMGLVEKNKAEFFPITITQEEFQAKEKKIGTILRGKVKEEGKDEFVWKKKENNYSYSWAIGRAIQHCIYHTGMISLLRHLVSAERLQSANKSWTKMVDTILFFEDFE